MTTTKDAYEKSPVLRVLRRMGLSYIRYYDCPFSTPTKNAVNKRII